MPTNKRKRVAIIDRDPASLISRLDARLRAAEATTTGSITVGENLLADTIALIRRLVGPTPPANEPTNQPDKPIHGYLSLRMLPPVLPGDRAFFRSSAAADLRSDTTEIGSLWMPQGDTFEVCFQEDWDPDLLHLKMLDLRAQLDHTATLLGQARAEREKLQRKYIEVSEDLDIKDGVISGMLALAAKGVLYFALAEHGRKTTDTKDNQ